MKTPVVLIGVISGVLSLSAMAQSAEKTVALRNNAESPARYATAVPKGGLNVQGTEVGNRQVFILVDVNGGDLADGDDVQIKYSDGQDSTYWNEGGEKISRVRGGTEKSTHFTVKKTDAGISLKAASGKFVTAPSKTDAPTLTDAAESAIVFEVVENPTVATKAPAEPTASPSPAAD